MAVQETLIWRQLQHVNVLPFVCLHHFQDKREKLSLVSPWMKNGNMQEYLSHKVNNANRVSLVSAIITPSPILILFIRCWILHKVLIIYIHCNQELSMEILKLWVNMVTRIVILLAD
jgi:hypothetical protein